MLQRIPEEVLLNILECEENTLERVASLRCLRLTCKSVSEAATKEIFRRLSLYMSQVKQVIPSVST